MQRQDSPKFPAEPNPYSTSCLFLPSFFPAGGLGLPWGGYRTTLLFSLLEKSRWVPTGAIGGEGEDCSEELRALDSTPLREKGVDEKERMTRIASGKWKGRQSGQGSI